MPNTPGSITWCMVSHELRTPLTAVLLEVDVLEGLDLPRLPADSPSAH